MNHKEGMYEQGPLGGGATGDISNGQIIGATLATTGILLIADHFFPPDIRKTFFVFVGGGHCLVGLNNQKEINEVD